MHRRIIGAVAAALLCLNVAAASAQEAPARRGWLGVGYDGGREGAGSELRVGYVHPGSPAAEAGIRAGDVIVRWNGAEDVQRAVSETRVQPGDTVRLRLRRGNASRELLVVAEPRPAELGPMAAAPAAPPGMDRSASRGLRERMRDPERARASEERMREATREMMERSREEAEKSREIRLEVLRQYLDGMRLDSLATVADSLHRGLRITLADSLQPRLEQLRTQLRAAGPRAVAALRWADVGARGVAGAELEEMNEGLARYFGTDRGLLVLRVSRGTPADRAGLEAGDVIVEVNGETVRSIETLRQEVARSRSLEMEVVRQGARRAVRLSWE